MKTPAMDVGFSRILVMLTCLLAMTVDSAPSSAASCDFTDDNELLELELVEVRHGDEVVSDLSSYRRGALSYGVSTVEQGGVTVFWAYTDEYDPTDDDSVQEGAYGEYYSIGAAR